MADHGGPAGSCVLLTAAPHGARVRLAHSGHGHWRGRRPPKRGTSAIGPSPFRSVGAAMGLAELLSSPGNADRHDHRPCVAHVAAQSGIRGGGPIFGRPDPGVCRSSLGIEHQAVTSVEIDPDGRRAPAEADAHDLPRAKRGVDDAGADLRPITIAWGAEVSPPVLTGHIHILAQATGRGFAPDASRPAAPGRPGSQRWWNRIPGPVAASEPFTSRSVAVNSAHRVLAPDPRDWHHGGCSDYRGRCLIFMRLGSTRRPGCCPSRSALATWPRPGSD